MTEQTSQKDAMTVLDLIQSLASQDASEVEVGVSVNNSDAYSIVDLTVEVDDVSGKKSITLLAGR